MSQLQNFLSYRVQGLSRIQSIFTRKEEMPKMLELPTHMIQFFRNSKAINPGGQSSTSKFNIAMLIEWIIDDIREYNAGVFQLEPSCLNIVFCILKMMELNLIVKIFNTPQGKQMSQQTRQFLQHKLHEAKGLYNEYCNKIRQTNCTIVSENHKRALDTLVSRRNEIEFESINPLIQLQISGAFSNIILNLRRQIRKNWNEKRSQIKDYFQPLKLLQVKLYYVSIAVFPPTQLTLRSIFNSVTHQHRAITYSYLIHDERGLQKIFNYLEEAPLDQLEKDMDLISKTVNTRQNRNNPEHI